METKYSKSGKYPKLSKLNILQAIHFPVEGAGAGHYVDTLSSGLVRQGHNVGVVHAQSPNCMRRETSYSRFPVDFKGNNLTFPFPVFESHPLGEDLTFGLIQEKELDQYLTSFEKQLDNAIERIKPDVVNVHHGWILGEMLSRKGIPYFVTLHGTETKAFDLFTEYQDVALKGLHGAQGIIALTEEHKNRAVSKYGIDPGKFSIITGGVDVDFFSPRYTNRKHILNKDGIAVNSSQPIALYVGRLTEVKGVEYLVDSAIHLKDAKKRPKILVVGDGILKKQLASVKEEYGLSDLHFLGLKNSKEIRSLYNSADLVVVPSLDECFPLVPTEAMACGIPVVSTNIPGGLDIQMTGLEKAIEKESEEKTSLRVPVKNSEALASKIIDILGMGFKRTMKKPIRGVSEGFSLEEMIKKTNDLYSGEGVI